MVLATDFLPALRGRGGHHVFVVNGGVVWVTLRVSEGLHVKVEPSTLAKTEHLSWVGSRQACHRRCARWLLQVGAETFDVHGSCDAFVL